jgi:hypothetical protein
MQCDIFSRTSGVITLSRRTLLDAPKELEIPIERIQFREIQRADVDVKWSERSQRAEEIHSEWRRLAQEERKARQERSKRRLAKRIKGKTTKAD